MAWHEDRLPETSEMLLPFRTMTGVATGPHPRHQHGQCAVGSPCSQVKGRVAEEGLEYQNQCGPLPKL